MVSASSRDPHLTRRGKRPERPARPAERAYAGIRSAILDGALAPREQLREETLAALTGTSRTPVREALRRLVAEGLAKAVNRHRYVSDFSYEEVVIIFDIRARLEGYAAQVAASKITREETDRLRRLIDAIDLLARKKPANAAMRFVGLNAEFHQTIIDATRSGQLKALLAPAVALPLVIIKEYVSDQHIDIARSNEQHRDILAALERGAGEWAAKAMESHILSTKPRPFPAAPASP